MSDEQGRKDLEELRTFWRETGYQLVRESVPTLEETAKNIITVVGILTGLYVNALGFSNLGKAGSPSAIVILYIAPICLWLISLIAASAVFWRASYALDLRDAVQIQARIQVMAIRKQRLLRIATGSLALGIATLVLVLIKYLT